MKTSNKLLIGLLAIIIIGMAIFCLSVRNIMNRIVESEKEKIEQLR